MEYIISDRNLKEIGVMPAVAGIDIDIGVDDDFLVTVPYAYSDRLQDGYVFFCPGTEYGGVLHDMTSNTEEMTVSYSGHTFRGMMRTKVVEPPAGQAYMVISGDIGECVAELFGSAFDDFFRFNTDVGINVTAYKVDRYVTLHDAVKDLMAEYDCHIKLRANNSGEQMYVSVTVVNNDTVDETEYSQDSRLDFKITKKTNLYTHMLVAGKGELQERTILYLYWNDGAPEVTGDIPNGMEYRTLLYTNTSYETDEELVKEAVKRFREENGTDQQSITAKRDLDADVGDYVSGRDYITGIHIRQQITRKIIKQQNNKTEISYEIGG